MAKVYRPTPRYGQRTLVVQGVLYMWGGLMDGLPSVHDEYDKFECTSYINIFSVTKGVWEKKRTTGKPPLGVYKYGCATVKKKLYYFGGWCGHEPIEGVCDGYHNSINVLDTTTLHWQQLSPTTDGSPMRRADCRMISFTCNNEDLLFIIGGNGVVPAVRQPRASYRKLLASIYYTNECNIFSPTTGQWSVPTMSGQCPTQRADFTLNELPHNRGILFAGFGNIDGGTYYNDVYIVELTKDTVHFTKFNQPDEPTIKWPNGRYGQDSVVITDDQHTMMVIVGGDPGRDSFIYNCDTNTWQKLAIPRSVSIRCCHSMSKLTISPHCVLLIMLGGEDYGHDDTTIIELVYTNSQWTVGKIIEGYGYAKVQEYLSILHRYDYFKQASQ